MDLGYVIVEEGDMKGIKVVDWLSRGVYLGDMSSQSSVGRKEGKGELAVDMARTRIDISILYSLI